MSSISFIYLLAILESLHTGRQVSGEETIKC
jgi:hypothetical protein